MKIRKFAVASAVAVMAFAGAAQAQEVDPCFALAQADCDLIASATDNTLASAQSFNQTWSIDFNVVGIPNSAPITFQASGSGPVALDTTAAFPISFDQTVTANFSDGMTDGGGDTRAILTDGVLYLDFGGGDFRSVNVNEALESGEVAGTTLPVNPSDLTSGDQMTQAMGLVNSLGSLATIDGFLVYTRSGSDFTFTVDLTQLINDPSFQTTVAALAESAGPEGQQAAGLAGLLPMILTEGTITVVQTVDEATNIVTGIDFNVNASVNAAMLAPEATEPIVITLAFSVDLSDVNSAVTIEAPATSTPLDTTTGS